MVFFAHFTIHPAKFLHFFVQTDYLTANLVLRYRISVNFNIILNM
ncbi:hypothetical protein CLOSTMETH_01033 [[Clostridium] methylpentosum DSM 5476]|uniref:Uncharacterized protein n=1 Tax=[Clostridium] methylpentosum DSM 5476 TaxID=537013 RepID=C0EB16_9FIRM|nr:hypothetical protein CLOSTMETH_01033 [[Clostridium] methylpentosum DSM 5476]